METGWVALRLNLLFPASEGWLLDAVAAALDNAALSQEEALETVTNFLGPSPEAQELVEELFSRRGGADKDGRALRVLEREPKEAPRAPVAADARAAPAPPKGRARKAAAATAAAEQAQNLGPCSLWRGRVVNCLVCGFVHDCRERKKEHPASLPEPLQESLLAFLASSECSHCGSPVREEDSGAASADASAAAAQTARLVTFDREGAARSTVVDDQADYVSPADNPWLSPAEREAAELAMAAAREAADERRRRPTISIDLIGRRVVRDDEAALEDAGVVAEAAAALESSAALALHAAAATEEQYLEGGGRHATTAAATAARLQEKAAQLRSTAEHRMMPCPSAPAVHVFAMPQQAAHRRRVAPN